MKTVTISKALMQVEEMLRMPNLDYIMIEPNENGDLEVRANIKIQDLDEREALGDED